MEEIITLTELLAHAPTSCDDCPRRDLWLGNRDMPDELACYEDCEDRNNWQQLLYAFSDIKKAEPKDKHSIAYDDWAEKHDAAADLIGEIKQMCEVFQHD